LWAKGLNSKDIHKEMFPVISVCSGKRFTTGLQMMPDQVWKWLRKQPKIFYAEGFDALVKRWASV
jgi:hypothetical protein